jgi:hypothetical protein
VGANIGASKAAPEQQPIGNVSPIQSTPQEIPQGSGLSFLTGGRRRILGAEQQFALSSPILRQQPGARRIDVTDGAASVVMADHPWVCVAAPWHKREPPNEKDRHQPDQANQESPHVHRTALAHCRCAFEE